MELDGGWDGDDGLVGRIQFFITGTRSSWS